MGDLSEPALIRSPRRCAGSTVTPKEKKEQYVGHDHDHLINQLHISGHPINSNQLYI